MSARQEDHPHVDFATRDAVEHQLSALYHPRKKRMRTRPLFLILAFLVAASATFLLRIETAHAWVPPVVTIDVACTSQGGNATVTVKNVEHNVPGKITASSLASLVGTTLAYGQQVAKTATVPLGSGTLNVSVTMTWYDSRGRVLDQRSASASKAYTCRPPTTTTTRGTTTTWLTTTTPPSTAPPTTSPPTTMSPTTTTAATSSTTTPPSSSSTSTLHATSTTSTGSTASTSQPPATTSPTTTDLPTGQADQRGGSLPVTGADSLPLAVLGLLLIAGGTLAEVARRRRQ